MSVDGLRIMGRQSLMMHMLTLSGPGDLLEGIYDNCNTFDLRTGNWGEIEEFLNVFLVKMEGNLNDHGLKCKNSTSKETFHVNVKLQYKKETTKFPLQ